MLRRVMLAAVAVAWWQLGAPSALAAEPSEACMAPLPPGSTDPVVRDVHFHLVGGGPLMTITACVASNHANPLQSAAANVGIFSKDGVLINYAGQSYQNVLPLANPAGSGPKLLLMFGVSVDIDPKYGQQFAPSTVVAMSTVACSAPLPQCDPAPAQTATFLLAVQLDQDLPKAK